MSKQTFKATAPRQQVWRIILGFVWGKRCYFHMEPVLQLPVSTLSLYSITAQIFLLDLHSGPVTAVQIRTMGSTSLSHRCQSSEQTRDNSVSSAERSTNGGGISQGAQKISIWIWWQKAHSTSFFLCSPSLLSRCDYRENVDPDQLIAYDTKKTYPGSCSLGPPGCSL